jgi:RNA polymerase sigma-70 factor (ECF subfamily)
MQDRASAGGEGQAEAAFRAALPPMIAPLRAYARTLANSRDAADDLVQEALARALAAWESFVPGSDLRAWLYTILRNTWFSAARRRARERRAAEAMHPPDEAAAADPGGNLALGQLARALAALPAEQREALMLVGAHGMSGEDAARLCGIAEGTLRARVSRARAALRRTLAGPPASLATRQVHRQA